jgi:beta-fructofuranosidase
MKSNMLAEIAAARRLRERLLADPQRPLWHLAAPEGYCMPFDPNGAIYWNGRYHLCYIFQDERGHCWGHVSSHDLVHWRWHPPALVPAPGDVDKGIFSGNCFVNGHGAATMLYHGVNAGNCIATSTDPDLDCWTKLAANPVVPWVAAGSPDASRYQSWDPHGWFEDGTHYAVFGGNPNDVVPPALFKAGADLGAWSFAGPFMTHDLPEVAAHEDVSCPDLFQLGDRHVLLCISHSCGARYYVGRWENERFAPELHRRMNWPGGACFAPESLLDGRGRRIFWCWAMEARPADRAPWGGVMTLPRVLSMAPDHTLFVDPVQELEQLRVRPRTRFHFTVPAGAPVAIDDVRGDSLEIEIQLRPENARRLGLKIRRSPAGEEETVIFCDRDAGTLGVDVAKASLDKGIVYRTFCIRGGENPPVTAQIAPFALAEGEELRLRVFLDRSVLEVFANRRQCLTQRIYPSRADSLGVAIFAEGGDATVKSLTAWDLAPANAW